MKLKMPLTNGAKIREMLPLLAGVLLLLAAPTMQFASLNNSGNFFWDNLSWDGNTANIGFCMTDQGSCTQLGGGAPGNAPFWALPGGGPDPNLFISSDQPITFTFEFGSGGDTNYDVFGVICPDAGCSGTSLFAGSAPSGTAVTLDPGDYALTLHNNDPNVNETWNSQAYLNPSGETADQHFVLFNAGSSFFIGVEDLPFCCTDLDYQDMVVQVTTDVGGTLSITGTAGADYQSWSAPEPGTFFLLFIGLLGLVGTMIMRRHQFASPCYL